MGKEYLLGQMDEDTKVHIETIKNTEKEHILGQMGECILDNGKMIKDMDSASTS